MMKVTLPTLLYLEPPNLSGCMCLCRQVARLCPRQKSSLSTFPDSSLPSSNFAKRRRQPSRLPLSLSLVSGYKSNRFNWL